jgi:hypothetical protein
MGYLLPLDDEGLRKPSRGLRWFSDGFFATSYLYWHTLQGGIDRVHERYAADRLAHYDDPELWRQHSEHLLRFVELAGERGARPIVVVWPRLDDVESSRAVTGKVTAFFRERGVRVLDLTEVCAREPREALVVSRLDAHPSRALHARVGRLLAPLVRAP